MESITIPANIVDIGSCAFKDCDSLTEVHIPGTVKTVGTYLFNNCDVLDTVYYGNGIESIGTHQFDYCTTVKHPTVPGTIKTATKDCFNCSTLESLVILDGLETIDSYAFSGHTA